MLFGNIEQLELTPFVYTRLQNTISEAVSIAKGNEEGKYLLSDERVFVVVASGTTEPKEARKAEVHKKYIDVQILLEGEECIGYSNHLEETVFSRASFENDLHFIDTVQNENFVELRPGDFALFYPGQIHRPMCAIDKITEVRKAIIKIPREVFE
jgi:biofilm protein TabA